MEMFEEICNLLDLLKSNYILLLQEVHKPNTLEILGKLTNRK